MRHLPIVSTTGHVRRSVSIMLDGKSVIAREGATLLETCRKEGIDVPTLCQADNLTPVNACRVCVVEVVGARTLVPACSRVVEAGMDVRTDSERVRLSRKVVFELLASSVDTSLSSGVHQGLQRYHGDPSRFGTHAEKQNYALKDDNNLFVRDYSKCVLCYKCVEACGDDAQNTFAISVGGRGFEAHIVTEYEVSLPDSACVFCGNCIAVCPTGALMFRSEHTLRTEGKWDESQQTTTDTVCPYCGVGCALTLHVQDNKIVKATSPVESSVTSGHLCVKGRFGWEYVNSGRG
jgi:predicted molibdopterin-dependent oxidoreductase YjgC